MKPVVVVKIGTNLLTTDDMRLDLNNLRNLIYQLCDVYDQGHYDFVVVSSGAIACGAERMGIQPVSIPEKQAAASVGQSLLMQDYVRFFGLRGRPVGQILLTKDELENSIIKTNAINTLSHLLASGVVPVVNENDSIATNEIGPKFGDNDELSSVVARLINAERLILLSDIDGVFTDNPKENPNATLIPLLDGISDETLTVARDIAGGRSRGGMASKLAAARDASLAGIEVHIANGRSPNVIEMIQSGKQIGTKVSAQ